MAVASLSQVVAFLDDYLAVKEVPDYPGALNGLQVEGPDPVRRVAVAVDASEAVIGKATKWCADLLLVHHGLFWDGLQPLVGRRFRKVQALVAGGTALYSTHLPLDAHTEVGNAAVLARKLGLTDLVPFGEYKGCAVGCAGTVENSAGVENGTHAENGTQAGNGAGTPIADIEARLAAVLGGPVRTLPGGPDTIVRVGVVTGGGASMLGEAAAKGLDALVTGEAQHHHAIDAAELGVTVVLGGHYATETWGVKATADTLQERFGVETMFVDSPTGL